MLPTIYYLMKLLQKMSYLLIVGLELLQQNGFLEQVVQKAQNQAFDGVFSWMLCSLLNFGDGVGLPL